MYRLLRADGEVRERRRQATHPPRTVPELVAAEPNLVWSYDATALRGPARGIWYDLFVMLDIFSRYSPGWMVVERGQDARVVRDWIEAIVAASSPRPRMGPARRRGPERSAARDATGTDTNARVRDSTE